MSDNEKPIDMDFLKQSIASLNDSCHELHAIVQTQAKQMQINERRWERFRKAGTAALEAFLRDDE